MSTTLSREVMSCNFYDAFSASHFQFVTCINIFLFLLVLTLLLLHHKASLRLLHFHLRSCGCIFLSTCLQLSQRIKNNFAHKREQFCVSPDQETMHQNCLFWLFVYASTSRTLETQTLKILLDKYSMIGSGHFKKHET